MEKAFWIISGQFPLQHPMASCEFDWHVFFGGFLKQAASWYLDCPLILDRRFRIACVPAEGNSSEVEQWQVSYKLIGSMSIFGMNLITYIYCKNQFLHVGKYTIHWSHEKWTVDFFSEVSVGFVGTYSPRGKSDAIFFPRNSRPYEGIIRE